MLTEIIRFLLGGFLMGTADLVPGVSGGTIALVLGIYNRLVASIRQGSSALGSLIKADFAAMRGHLGAVEWPFLLPLLGGILAAVVLLAGFLEDQLEERPTLLAGVFFGLVLASVVIAWRLVRRPSGRHPIIALAVGGALFLVLGAGEGAEAGAPALLVFFGAGALAICAMILPGISGSLILLMIGMYGPVLGAVTDRDFLTIAVFGLGAVVGLGLFSQVLHWALAHHHDNVVAALVGLMAGSTRVLWPWPDGVSTPVLGAPGDDWVVVLLAALAGAAGVLSISRLAVEHEAVSV